MIFPILIGPTASGKSNIALKIARYLNKYGYGPAEIINADAIQIFKKMNIGTAKPNFQDNKDIPHHLYDINDPKDENTNVGDWLRHVNHIISDIQNRNGIPILCGGTHMYINTFLYGLLDSSPTDVEKRKYLENQCNENLIQELLMKDPKIFDKIHKNDRYRMIRALEFYHQNGKKLSEMQSQWKNKWRKDALVVALSVDKELINKRIDKRVDIMIDQGLEKEVYKLWKNNELGKNARMAIGYSHFCNYFENNVDGNLNEVIDQIKRDTRGFAKRQRTWFRRMERLQEEQFMKIHIDDTIHNLTEDQIAIQIIKRLGLSISSIS